MFLVRIRRQVPSEQKAHFSSKLQLNPVNTVLLPRQEKTQGVWKENSWKLRMELGAIRGVHWEVLAAQEMVPLLHRTLKEAIQVVNYIKRRAYSFFKNWAEILVMSMCVISRGKDLSHFYELRAEICAFPAWNNSPRTELFSSFVGAQIFGRKWQNLCFQKVLKTDSTSSLAPVMGQKLDWENVMNNTIMAYNKLLGWFNDYFLERQRHENGYATPLWSQHKSIMPAKRRVGELSCHVTPSTTPDASSPIHSHIKIVFFEL